MQSQILNFSRPLLLLRQLLTGNESKVQATAARIMHAEKLREGKREGFLKERNKREGTIRSKTHPV
jgi:hypothetical protein